MKRDFTLSRPSQAGLILLSFVITAFGQPAWYWWLGLISAVCGMALFWRVLLGYETWKQRFLVGTIWFGAVTFVQLSWAISHPYVYIYAVLVMCCALMGVQFGLLCALITPERLMRCRFVFVGAAIWTIMEWSRLWFLSGYTWNPSGLALTGSVYPLQSASLWGVFGLTFWFVLVNLLALRTWVYGQTWVPRAAFAAAALFPYVFGVGHLLYHDRTKELQGTDDQLTALLVQPLFPVEGRGAFSKPEQAIIYVLDQWRHILQLSQPYYGHDLDLIVLPEYVVPFGTYWPVYSLEAVKAVFASVFGRESWDRLPVPQEPDAVAVETPTGKRWVVSNAYIIQGIANLFNSSVVTGLQDEEDSADGTFQGYSAAFHFLPNSCQRTRYEKQVLLPMGEYIPFSFCRDIAARYGIVASFTPGTEAKLQECSKVRFGISICYEETFGNLMRHNRAKGAELLVNVTNDGWYPNSRVSQQHFDHSRLRTVEMGIPLVRAANTGVTGAVDSLGRVVALLEKDNVTLINDPGAVKVSVPLYHYSTLYTIVGDAFILTLAVLVLAFSARLFFGPPRP